jgi:O-antigen/teichoic acid export membrane protein
VLIALGPTVSLLAVVAFILTGTYGIATSVFTSVIGTLAMSVGFALYWRSPWRLRWDGDVARYLVGHGSRIALATLLNSSLIWTDTLLISHFLDLEQAGIYQAAFSLTFIMVTASVAIGVALVPVMSRLAGKGESTALAYQRGTLLALALSLLVALGYLVLGRAILGFYRPEFLAGYPALLILTIFGIFGALAVPASSVLMVHDKAGKLILVGAMQVAINLPLNYFLIQRFGITGAAVATTTAFVAGTVALWVLVRRETGAWPLSPAVLREGPRALGRALGRRRVQ